MKRTLIEYCGKHGLLPEGAHVLCAVSGGADSVSLLHALLAAQDELKLSISAAHFNHHIRESAGRDEEFVRSLCRLLQVPFYCGQGDVPARARQAGEGLEEAARRLRYDFLLKTAESIGADRVATAHTADDNMETVILNLARGSGAAGISGIPPQRGIIVRPLLGVTRAEVEAYLSGNGLEHVEDETNDDEAYARNRVRKRVSPVLRSLNPQAAGHFLAAGEFLRQDNELLAGLAEEIAKKAGIGENPLTIDVAILRAAPPPLRARALRILFERLGAGSLSRAHTEAVLAIVEGNHPSAQVHLPGGLAAFRQNTALVIGAPPAAREFQPITLKRDGVTKAPELGILVICGKAEGDKKVHNSVNTFCINCDTIRGNFVLRPRREGDRIKLPGRPEKSLKKLFIDEKIPVNARGLVPVIADDNGVIAVSGYGVDVRRCGGKDTLLIEIQAEDYEGYDEG